MSSLVRSISVPTASQISNAPAGGVASLTIQAAINELDTEKARLDALAASGGSSLLGFLPSGAGMAARTVQSKLRDIVSITDASGIDITATDDSTAGTQAALNSFGAGGGLLFVPGHVALRIDSDLNIPDSVSLIGAQPMAAIETPVANMALWTPRISLLNTATIKLNNSSDFKNLAVLARNVSFAKSSAQVAADFTGQAVTLVDNTSDHLVEDCLILGFNTAIGSTTAATNMKRSKVRRVILDCLNGVFLRNCFDIPFVSEVQGRPLCSFNATGEANTAHLKRSGSFIRLDGVADYAKVTDCFSFGWMTGFQASGSGGGAITWLSCGADHPPGTSDGSKGYDIANVYESRIIGGQVSAKDHGVWHNNADAHGKLFMDSVNIWATVLNAVVNERGTIYMTGCGLRGPGVVGAPAGNGVYALNTSTKTKIINSPMNGFGIGIKTDAAGVKVYHDFCDFQYTTTPVNNPYLPSVVAANPLPIDGESSLYRVAGATNFNTVAHPEMYAGKLLTLKFDAALFASNGGNMKLVSDFGTTANDTLTLTSDGTTFYEVSRSANV